MPGIYGEEFKQHYLRIIAKIALKAVQNGDVSLDNGALYLYLEKNRAEYQEEIEELNFLQRNAEKAELNVDGFNFNFGNDLFAHEVNDAVLRFFVQDIFDINETAPYKGRKQSRLDELDDIPEGARDEIKAMAYVATFQELRKNADDKDSFLHFVEILEKMSDGVKSSTIDNPKISAELTRTNGILKNVENAGNNLTKEKAEALIAGGSKSIIFDRAEKAYDLQQRLKRDLAKYLAESNINIFDHDDVLTEGVDLPNFLKREDIKQLGVEGFLPKQFEAIKSQQGLVGVRDFLTALGIDETNMADFSQQVKGEKDRFSQVLKDRKESLRINKLQSANAKEQLAIKILKVSGVSEGQINRIMQNPDAKFAVVRRAAKAFENMGIDLEEINIIGIDEVLKNVDSKVLQGEIEKQSKEFIAQVGRVSSRSLDLQDMRGNEHLHDKYQAKANKMDEAEFDKNAEKALEYEIAKDKSGKGETLRKIIDKAFTDDKPFFTPGKTAIVAAVAFAVLVPPLGAIAGIALLGKAIKNKFYDGSKLQKQVNEKFYNKPPQKFDSQELEQVTVKGLSQAVKAQYSAVNQEQQGVGELGKQAKKEVAMSDGRGQSVQAVREQARNIAGDMRGQGVDALAVSSTLDSARGSYVESVRRHNASSAISR